MVVTDAPLRSGTGPCLRDQGSCCTPLGYLTIDAKIVSDVDFIPLNFADHFCCFSTIRTAPENATSILHRAKIDLAASMAKHHHSGMKAHQVVFNQKSKPRESLRSVIQKSKQRASFDYTPEDIAKLTEQAQKDLASHEVDAYSSFSEVSEGVEIR